MIDYKAISLTKERRVPEIVADLVERGEQAGFRIVDVDDKRPWGGFVRFESSGAEEFAKQFFAERLEELAGLGFDQISPKFLLVAPGQRLSWQRHQRRSELWRYLTAGGGYSKSFDADDQPVFEASEGQLVELGAGECHRLLSQSETYVLVAEVWRHTEPGHLSDEEDNERLQDDYKRG